MPSAASSIETPCNRVCIMHPGRQIGIGCGRTLDEIARWTAFGDAERAEIMAQLPSRLAAANSAQRALA